MPEPLSGSIGGDADASRRDQRAHKRCGRDRDDRCRRIAGELPDDHGQPKVETINTHVVEEPDQGEQNELEIEISCCALSARLPALFLFRGKNTFQPVFLLIAKPLSDEEKDWLE